MTTVPTDIVAALQTKAGELSVLFDTLEKQADTKEDLELVRILYRFMGPIMKYVDTEYRCVLDSSARVVNEDLHLARGCVIATVEAKQPQTEVHLFFDRQTGVQFLVASDVTEGAYDRYFVDGLSSIDQYQRRWEKRFKKHIVAWRAEFTPQLIVDGINKILDAKIEQIKMRLKSIETRRAYLDMLRMSNIA